MNKHRRAHYVDTTKHKLWVMWYTLKTSFSLMRRAAVHDLSKFSKVEVLGYETARPLFRQAEYESDKYKRALEIVKPAFDHHCWVNSHHPEHYENGIVNMSPLDLLEMLVDWKSSARYRGEEVRLDVNSEKFNIPNVTMIGFIRDIEEIGL